MYVVLLVIIYSSSSAAAMRKAALKKQMVEAAVRDKSDVPKKLSDLSLLEVNQLALKMAERLNHVVTQDLLRKKISSLEMNSD